MSTQVEKTSKKAPREASNEKNYLRPYYQVVAGDASYDIQVYLPGVAHDDAAITLDGNSLSVKAERTPHWENLGRFVHREIPEAAYQLYLELNVPVDSSKITASSKDGILQIHLPVADEAKPKKIAIQ